MNKYSLSIFAIIAGCGVAMGWLGGRLTLNSDEAQIRDQSKKKSNTESFSNSRPQASALSKLRSTDTYEDLVSLSNDELYPRLALWLLDASAEDVAAYYENYLQREVKPNDITDLIFINWARLDPLARINHQALDGGVCIPI